MFNVDVLNVKNITFKLKICIKLDLCQIDDSNSSRELRRGGPSGHVSFRTRSCGQQTRVPNQHTSLSKSIIVKTFFIGGYQKDRSDQSLCNRCSDCS